MTIQHQLSLAHPERRSVQVTVTADLPSGTTHQEICFPVWTPGSYLVREHQRHLHDVRAQLDGRPAPVTKTAKNVYRVETGGGGRLTLSYEVYAHELTVRTNHVDPGHAFLNPVALVPYLPGREGEEQRLSITGLPAGWGAACALPETESGTFVAADYDELVDSPLECGPHARPESRRSYVVAGVTHELVFWGRSPLDVDRYVEDCRKITEAQAAFFGGLPYSRYLFIVLATGDARGGLEHRACSALIYARDSVRQPRGYQDLLGLTSHELFHAWNVKRIKPAAFTPYDLNREATTRLLWAFEGLTSYYEDIFLVRAGLMSRTRYVEQLGEHLTALERNPGRLRHPVTEASYDAWIRYYRQDENWNNSSTSYYLKGSLIGLLLDLEIRRRTQGERSLDDVMRLLFERYGKTGVGVPEDGVERAVEEVAGSSFEALFAEVLHGTAELPLEAPFTAHGLTVSRRVPVGTDDKGGNAPSGQPIRSEVGLAMRSEAGRVKVSSVRRGSPAEEAGICPGDEIVAVDGLRAEGGSLAARLADLPPGAPVEVALFRRDELKFVTVVPMAARADAIAVSESPSAGEEARNLLSRWLSR